MSGDVVTYERAVVPAGSTAVSVYQEQQRQAAAVHVEQQRKVDPMGVAKSEHAHYVGAHADSQGFVDTKIFSHNLVMSSGYTLPPGKVHAGEAFQLLEGARLAGLTQDQVNIILQHVAKYA